MRQEKIRIGEAEIPIIIDEDGVRWFPISQISEKVLLRKGNGLLDKKGVNTYGQYLKIYRIAFSEKNIQECRCINECGLKLRLIHTEVGRLSVQQRKNQNILHEMFGLEKFSEKELLKENIPESELQFYDTYTRDIINSIIKNEKFDCFQLCHSCDMYYPQHVRFFTKSKSREYSKLCRKCLGYSDVFSHDDLQIKRLKLSNQYNEKVSERNPVYAYTQYINNNISRLPIANNNNKDYLAIIKYLYDNNKFRKSEISMNMFYERFKLNSIREKLSIDEINRYLFGDNYYLRSWEFDNFSRFKLQLSKTDHLKMLDTYLKSKRINKRDKFKINYIKIFDDMHILKNVKDHLSELVLEYYSNAYPCYKFTGMYQYKHRYYQNRENRNREMRYFIEEEMKIPIEKIPLYITLNVLQKNRRSLYNMVKKYYKNLFEIIDECYPGKFVEADFVINAYRNEFDSNEEAQIHDVLLSKFKNKLIYNDRKNPNVIKLNGMVPDWIIINETACWIIEYFGLFIEKARYNKRIEDYINKTENKINKYNAMIHKTIFIYPDDLDNGMAGLYEKIGKIT